MFDFKSMKLEKTVDNSKWLSDEIFRKSEFKEKN